MFVPVGGAEPDFDVIIEGNLTVQGQEVLLPEADLVMDLGTIKANDAEFRGPVSCSALTTPGNINAANGVFTGTIQADGLDLNGPLQLTQLTADTIQVLGGITAASAALAGAINCDGVISTGPLRATSAIISGSIDGYGHARFPAAALTAASVQTTGELLVGAAALIAGNLTVQGALSVEGGIDPPPVIDAYQCSYISFGQLRIVFGSGTTGFDGSVTYSMTPFQDIYAISATGASGVNCLYSFNTANPAAGSIRLVSTSVSGVPSGAGVRIFLVGFIRNIIL